MQRGKLEMQSQYDALNNFVSKDLDYFLKLQ